MRALYLLPLLAILSACSHGTPGPAELRTGLNQIYRDPYSDTRSLDVYYATNRDLTGEAACGDQAFGVASGKELHFGDCQVNIPKKHPVGSIENATTPRSDPHQFFRVLGHSTLTADTLGQALRKGGEGQGVLVFIHGFNVKFEEAVLRAAQLAYDLKFQGPVLLYSWPAGAASGFFDSKLINRTYEANRANARDSIPHAAALFKLLAGLNVPVNVVVHSMGHQVTIPALAASAPDIGKPFIEELVLNAPDIPVDEFTKLAPALRTLARRITVYCSYNDNAIAASESYNNGRRMGGCERAEGVEVINVSDIDPPAFGIGGLGHGYYASRPILTDVYQVLLGIEAERRLFIRRSEPNSIENFILRP